MSAQPQFDKPWVSIEEYLAGELVSDIKHEYYDGEVVAMAGVSKNHDRIKMNLAAALHSHLRGQSCEPFASDVKVKIGQYLFYPDVMVVCEDTSNHDYYADAGDRSVVQIHPPPRRSHQASSLPNHSNLAGVLVDRAGHRRCRSLPAQRRLGIESLFSWRRRALRIGGLGRRRRRDLCPVVNDDVLSFISEQAAGDANPSQVENL